MGSGRARVRALRQRRVFNPDNLANELPMWEQQIAASIESCATVLAERWDWRGPISVGKTTSVSNLEPGWLLKIYPTSLVVDIALPQLDREDAGRMIAVQHTGSTRSIIRLGYATVYVAAVTSVGAIASVVWDGQTWAAVTGGVEWVEVPNTPEIVSAGSASPLSQVTLAGWSSKVQVFPSGAVTNFNTVFRLPRTWIGTDVKPALTVIPIVSGTGNAQINLYYRFAGLGVAPPWATSYAAAAPLAASQGTVVGVTPALASVPLRVPFADVPTPIGSFTALDAAVNMFFERNGTSGLDTYTVGAPNNLMLWTVGLLAQCCAVGSRMVT